MRKGVIPLVYLRAAHGATVYNYLAAHRISRHHPPPASDAIHIKQQSTSADNKGFRQEAQSYGN